MYNRCSGNRHNLWCLFIIHCYWLKREKIGDSTPHLFLYDVKTAISDSVSTVSRNIQSNKEKVQPYHGSSEEGEGEKELEEKWPVEKEPEEDKEDKEQIKEESGVKEAAVKDEDEKL